MRIQSLCSGVLLLVMASRAEVGAQASAAVPVSKLPERHTAAFDSAAKLHAKQIAKLPNAADAGLWIVQDTAGHLISSGILATFPTEISNGNYGSVVPGAAGLTAREFGVARTRTVNGMGPFRVAFVTVATRPGPSRSPRGAA